MTYVKTLTYLISLEVCYHCCRIIEHFIHRSYFYCLCNRYRGCVQGLQGEDYCIVCRTCNHYTLEKLEKVKCNSFQLEKFYQELLRDLSEVLEIDSTVCFWNDEFFYKSRDWISGTESHSCLRDVISVLFACDCNGIYCNYY